MTWLDGALSCGLLLAVLWIVAQSREIRRLHRLLMRAWMAQGAAQDEAHRLRADLAEAHKRLGALQATRGEVLEAAIGVATLAQLDALRPPDSSKTA